MSRYLLLSIGASILLLKVADAVGEARLMLDDLSQYFEGKDYSSNRYERLLRCFNKWNDTDLIVAQDASFAAYYDVWLAGGISYEDPWGNVDIYYESDQNKTAILGSGFRTYEVQQRCNYASNVAYYSAALRVCDYQDWFISLEEQAALMKTAVGITSASSWFHGSLTRTGIRYDVMGVGILANNAYQILIKSVNTSSSVFLTASDLDISSSNNIVEIVDDFVYLPLRQPPAQWDTYLSDRLANRVSRQYEQTVMAILAFACSVSLSIDICECLVSETLAPVALDDRELEFFREQYMPALKVVVEQEGLPLPARQGIPLFFKTFGTTVALLWSVVFVEIGLDIPELYGPTWNLTLLGQFSSPVVDFIVSELTDVPETDRLKELYPGASFCRRDSPHALWHELSAEAIFETYVVMDEINRVLTKRKEGGKQGLMETLQSAFNSIRGAGRH
ncbi:unknown protein [Seminavis robusta]|uniref:Uncharacterized protein n=1 Tax=Seminavis robusta TaxID=568900 RepID=A0A9N8DYH0_9STRA|nr:unknown protein [Seminavis robusta]|eukprot:Sro390_g132950.1 n/a (449) ;mRNA; f:56883-58322